jgi:FkbM family methyltransferase
MTGNVYYGLAEYEDMLFVLRLLRPGDVFVDVGANIGSYTVLASGVAGARTHAFEPIEQAFDVLCRNVRLNGIEQLVTLHRAAVGSRNGVVTMSAGHDTMNRVLDGESLGVTVPLVTLSDELAGLRPVLIKIDVEGYEAEVLAGADAVLKGTSLVALIVETGSQAVATLLAERNFAPFRYGPLERALRRLPGLDSRGNTLFIRDLRFVEDRLASAPPIRLRGRTY